MSSITRHVCTACEAFTTVEGDDPSALPAGWKHYDDGARLLCQRCQVIRRRGGGYIGANGVIPDERFGLVHARPEQLPLRRCDGCRQIVPKDVGRWSRVNDSMFCGACSQAAEDERRKRAFQDAPTGSVNRTRLGSGLTDRDAQNISALRSRRDS